MTETSKKYLGGVVKKNRIEALEIHVRLESRGTSWSMGLRRVAQSISAAIPKLRVLAF